jgi:two-component system, chemotaxis family, CheB/CheR fusion protein
LPQSSPKYDRLPVNCREVLEKLIPVEKEVVATDGKWLNVIIMPYRSVNNAVGGLVITLTDITDKKLAQQRERTARLYAENIVDTIRVPLLVLNGNLRMVSANRSFYKTFQVSETEINNTPFFEFGHEQWKIPELEKLLKDILKKKKVFENFTVKHEFPNLGPKVLRLTGRQIVDVEIFDKMIDRRIAENSLGMVQLECADILVEHFYRNHITHALH